MTKLHELLAVSNNLEGQAGKCVADLKETFQKKHHLFNERTVTFQPNTEGAPAVTEEQLDLQTTVTKELTWIAGFLAKLLDVDHAINEANTQARADVMLEDGTLLLTNMPATSLLELEKRLKWLHELIGVAPTLDPAKGFQPDAARGVGVYRAREVTRTRTAKTATPIVLYEATDKHPAQVQLINQDVPTGTIRQLEWSGMLTPAEKAAMLDRCETLTRAVKRARSRANEVPLSPAQSHIGTTLLNYVFGH